MKKLIISTIFISLLFVTTTMFFAPVYSSNDLTYDEGECISFYRKSYLKTNPIILKLSSGNEYVIRRDYIEVLEKYPNLVGLKIKVGATEESLMCDGYNIAYLIIEDEVIYDLKEYNKSNFSSYVFMLFSSLFISVCLNIKSIEKYMVLKQEKRDREKKKKKNKLYKERRKLGWNSDNISNKIGKDNKE